MNETWLLIISLLINVTLFWFFCRSNRNYEQRLSRAIGALQSAVKFKLATERELDEIRSELNASRATITKLRKSINETTEQINRSGRITDESASIIKRMRDILKNCKTDE